MVRLLFVLSFYVVIVAVYLVTVVSAITACDSGLTQLQAQLFDIPADVLIFVRVF